MSRRKKKKPYDPAAAARFRAEREQNAAEVARLQSDPEVLVVTDNKTGRLTGAHRVDVVEAMVRSGKMTYAQEEAVRGLEALITRANGPSPACLGTLERISGGEAPDPAGRQLDAIKALTERERCMDKCTWSLVRDLCDGNLLSTRWPQVVRKWTGETNPDAQKGAMRLAFQALADAEANIRAGCRPRAA